MGNEISQPELKKFVKMMEVLSNRHHYSTILDDFVSMSLNAFTVDGSLEEKTKAMLAGYKDNEKTVLRDMFYEMVSVFDRMIATDKSWYDFFGNLYMFIASNWRQSSMGQFFTPESVVNFMAEIQGEAEELIGKGLKVSDPACGSGRCLIAFHAKFPGNYTFGEDIDPLCAKMSALNMMLHGCEGEVVCHDSLRMNWNFGFKINPMIRQTGLPSISELRESESFVMKIHQQKMQAHEPIRTQPKILKMIKPVQSDFKEHQLQLFG